MVNSAIIAGLVAGYTVSAVITALLAAEDAPVDDGVRFAAVARSGSAACLGALRRGRGAGRCVAGRSPDRFVTTRRR